MATMSQTFIDTLNQFNQTARAAIDTVVGTQNAWYDAKAAQAASRPVPQVIASRQGTGIRFPSNYTPYIIGGAVLLAAVLIFKRG